MAWTNKITRLLLLLLMPLCMSCSISYKFSSPASLDYNKVKTMMITDFPIRSDYVYAPLGTKFNEDLKDAFVRQTRLQMVKRNPDLSIEGEITGYNQYNEAVNSSGYASKTKLTLTINVRFVNNVDHKKDFERQFSAFRTYDSTQLLTQVQDELIAQMTKEIIDQIFNATVVNW